MRYGYLNYKISVTTAGGKIVSSAYMNNSYKGLNVESAIVIRTSLMQILAHALGQTPESQCSKARKTIDFLHGRDWPDHQYSLSKSEKNIPLTNGEVLSFDFDISSISSEPLKAAA